MNYLFKSCIMLGFVALGLNSTVAQAITDVKQECLSNKKLTSYQFNLKNKNLKIARDTGSTKVYAPVKTASDFMYEADGKSVNVTLIPNYGNEELDYEQINAMDSKGEVFYITDESFGVYTAELPVGTYDFLYYFSTPQEDYYVIKEQVEINSDVTLDLDIAEADKKYVLNTFLPDGEKCTLKRIKYNKDTNQYDVIEKGSINDIFTDMFLSLNGSIIYGKTYEGSYQLYDEPKERPIHISSTSDRFAIDAISVFSANDMYYFTQYNRVNDEGIIKNDFSKFELVEENFIPTLNANIAECDAYQGFSASYYTKGLLTGDVSVETKSPAKDNKVKFYLNAPQSSALNLVVSPSYIDNLDLLIEDYWGDGDVDTTFIYSGICGQKVTGDKDNIQHVVVNAHDMAENLAFLNDANGNIVGYPGNPAFSFTKEQKTTPYGYGVPINSFMHESFADPFSGENISIIDCCYVGRYGEARTADLITLNTVGKFNGEVVCNNYYDMYDTFNELGETGEIDITFENTNFEVGGLKGKNITNVHYNTSLEDYFAPTMQMLWFRNTDGAITESFSNAEEGIIEFAAGDFNFIHNKGYYFDCQEQNVEVSYAPYCSDEWAELPVSEIAENYFMPGFGYFYRGALDVVKSTSENGWYDVKIMLTDKSGNYQEQVISPAFYIGDAATGIEVIENSDKITDGVVYSLSGIKVANGQGDTKLPAGIYIKNGKKFIIK